MGKLTMALTYLTTIVAGVVFVYLTVVTGGAWTLIFAGVLVVILAAYWCWGEFFRRERQPH